jgi:hypothetical protein
MAGEHGDACIYSVLILAVMSLLDITVLKRPDCKLSQTLREQHLAYFSTASQNEACLPAADELPQMRAHRAAFYGAVYGVVLDTGQLLAALLAKKERVAEAALQQVVAEALG